jgi:sugar/nucleoside kinase (ribokinase family)
LKLLVVGGLSFDFIGAADTPLRADSFTVPLSGLVRSNGGRGANVAVYARALGCDVQLASAVGDDFKSSPYRSELEQRGVGLESLYWGGSPYTQHVFTFTSDDDARVYVFRDRRPELEESFRLWVTRLAAEGGYDAVYCTYELPRINAETLASRRPRMRFFSPGPDIHRYDASCLMSCLKDSDVTLVNSSELKIIEAVTGELVSSLSRRLSAFVVTDGSRGSDVYLTDDSFHMAPVVVDHVADSTGAGDAYAAGFIAGVVGGSDFRRSAQIASTVASFAVEAFGCQSAVPTCDQVESRRAVSYEPPAGSRPGPP